MHYLLVSDIHLDDQPQNEYRWLVFEHIRSAVIQYNVDTVFILGDLVDRKDEFKAAFVNRLLTELHGISGRSPVVMLRGNHDTTVRPPNYFEFLNSFAADEHNIDYVTNPTEYADGKLLLLPFTAKPKEDWAKFRLSNYVSVFMHATVTGAQTENGQVMENSNFPLLPGKVKFYSGDIHVPQKVRNIVYVGAPHPIKFGDVYPCRMLLLDKDFDISLEIPLSGPKKLVADISNLKDLNKLKTRPGDQIKIRYSLSVDELDGAHLNETKLSDWARERGVTIAGIEASLDSKFDVGKIDVDQSPEVVLRQFAEQEGIDEDLLSVGLNLLRRL